MNHQHYDRDAAGMTDRVPSHFARRKTPQGESLICQNTEAPSFTLRPLPTVGRVIAFDFPRDSKAVTGTLRKMRDLSQVVMVRSVKRIELLRFRRTPAIASGLGASIGLASVGVYSPPAGPFFLR